jgi:hypothetical protein
MVKPRPFNLADFAIDPTSQIHLPVCIPHNMPFRIHPDAERTATVFLSRAGDEWWLLHPKVVERYRAPRLWQADLYEGVQENGMSFVLPVTYPLPGYEGWYESLSHAVQLARKRWVSIESDREQGRYNMVPGASKVLSIPAQWLDGEFSEIVEVAFLDRIISSVEEAKVRLPKTSKRKTEEVIED